MCDWQRVPLIATVTVGAAYLPATQSSQAVLTPDEALYFPAPQLVQSAAPANEYVPAGQPRQVSTAVAPSVVENLPAMQSLHVEAPAVVEYLPDGQSVHIDAPAIA